MMKVKYTGTSHYREIRPEDAEREGVKTFGEETKTWDKGGVLEVNDAVGKWLTEDHSGEFEVVQDSGRTAAGSGQDALIPPKADKA